MDSNSNKTSIDHIIKTLNSIFLPNKEISTEQLKHSINEIQIPFSHQAINFWTQNLMNIGELILRTAAAESILRKEDMVSLDCIKDITKTILKIEEQRLSKETNWPETEWNI